MQKVEPISKLLKQHQDHALIAESADWDDVITPALVQFGQLCDANTIASNSQGVLMRVLFEAVYQMGYERGCKNGKTPMFQVCEEA